MAVTPNRIDVLATMPVEREETYRRASVAGGKTVVHEAYVSVLRGDVVLVSHDCINMLLELCGFTRVTDEPTP